MDWNLILLGVIASVTFAIWWVRKKYKFFEENGIPSVKPTFPLGNFWGVGTERHFSELMLDYYREMKGKHVIGGMYFFVFPGYIALDLDLLKHILVKDFQYFHDRGVYVNEKDDPLSGHLFALSGQRWKTLRNKLSPTFTSGKMKMMHLTIIAVAKEFQNYLGQVAEKNGEIEIKDILARFTTDVIGNTAFGIECNSLKDPDTEFRRIADKVFDFKGLEMLRQLFIGVLPNLARKLGAKAIKPEVSDFFMRLLRVTTEYREKNNIKRNDFLQLLLQLKNTGQLDGEDTQFGKMTFEELAAQTFLFFIAGFETSSSTMSFALYELAQQQDIQDRAREEIHQVLKKHNEEFTYEACMEMKYLDRVINETLRKYPVAPTIMRQVTKDYKLPDHDFVMKKDSVVLISVNAIHHDPEIYPDPEKFDPDRFTDENIKSRHPYAWLPFGEGPRICIGMRFGMMQTRVGLANLLQKYRVKTCSRTPIPLVLSPSSSVLSAKSGIWLRLEKV
ncbi:cytochrome P450 6a9-like [Phlebotomus argentipes]|uniref:cytochrome P450 6a9-like n=1 Tax=Phlebotomus argentipes TaxID=94469 RepID=UPI0028935F35|nr:cytochrome P450 6a9-like [Phlebotomus argentipes]